MVGRDSSRYSELAGSLVMALKAVLAVLRGSPRVEAPVHSDFRRTMSLRLVFNSWNSGLTEAGRNAYEDGDGLR